ncbi:MAG: hypothetical protein IKD72_09740 [Clostridia bacterium]|nr:hypothetical protein [Clostridia bacterium]
MKQLKKLLFPFLLVAACCVVHFWQNAVASLPYLPFNCIVPLGILTPLLLILTFFATYVMLRQSGTARPVLRAFLGVAGMLVPVLMTLVFFLSFVSYRFAGKLPVLVLPNWPTGIVTAILAGLCILHLTGLLICRCKKQQYGVRQVLPIFAGWIVLNVCLFLMTI